MPLNLAGADAYLKEFYEGAAREQLNNEVPLLRLLETSEKAYSGRRVTFPAHTGRNTGVGSRAENGTLPTGGSQEHLQVSITATYFYARGRITGQTLAAGKNAFVEALSSEMEGLMNDAKVDLSRQCWGTGDGRLAQVGLSQSLDSSAVTFYNRFFEPQQPGARFLNQSQSLEFGTVASPNSLGTNVVVKSISISSNPATTTDTVQISGSHGLFSQCETYAFNFGAGGQGVEVMGLQALIDDHCQANMWGAAGFAGSSVQGINRGSVNKWNAVILHNSGTKRIIDGTLVQNAFDQIDIESGMTPDLIMGHHGVVRAFLDSVAGDRRYVTAGAPKYDAGFSGLSYNGVSIETDRFAPYNNLLIMKKDVIKKFVLKPIGFADNDGSILSRVDGVDSWDFWLCTYFNLGINGVLKASCFIRDIEQD